MTSRPPPESEPKDAGNEEGPPDSQERFETLARGLLRAPRGPVLDAEKRFKDREKRRSN